MYKHLFFDDQRLYVRQGLRREYGTPQVVGTYVDPNLSSPYGWAFAQRGPDGKVHLLYNGILKTDDGKPVHGYGIAASAESPCDPCMARSISDFSTFPKNTG